MIKIINLFIFSTLIVSCQTVSEQGMTQQQADAILKELKEIKVLLKKGNQQARGRGQADKEPSIVTTKINKRPALGKADAPITLIEFTDYQCPFCSRFHSSTMQQLKKKYVATGKLRIIVQDYPLQFHKQAKGAARAAQCANEQGKYWEYRDLLFKNQKKLADANLQSYAKQLSLDSKKFKSCVSSSKYDKQIAADMAAAQRIGITGTPSFVLGKTTKDKVTGLKIVGARPYAVFDAHIKSQLKIK